MKEKYLLLSVYPLSRGYLDRLEAALGEPFGQKTLAELRATGGVRLPRELLRLRPSYLLLPMEDENSAALLPILKLLACFTGAASICLAAPDGKLTPVPRVGLVSDIAHFFFASLGCLWTAAKAALALSRLKRQPRGTFRLPNGKSGVLYLKTNLWFGIKAGGSIGHIAGVVNSLQTQGHPVHFASAERPVMVHPAVTFVPVSTPRVYGLPYELNNYRFQDKFVKALIGHPAAANAEFIYQRLSAANYLGVTISRRYQIPLVVEYNGSEAWIAKNWGKAMKFHRLAVGAEDVMLQHAHVVVTISDVLRRELIARGVPDERIVSYPNCIDPEVFDPTRFSPADSLDLRKRYGLSSDDVIITFVGTFGQWHGAEVLAGAIARLHQERSGWLASYRIKFLLIGDGLKMPAVKAIINSAGAQEHVIFAGLVPQAEAPAYLAASDVLVSPHVANADGTPFFGSPTKLFEYMAMGKGILASDLEQIGEVLQPALRADTLPLEEPGANDSALAVLASPGDVDQLIVGLKFLVEQKKWRDHLGTNARRCALANFTWDHHVSSILDGLTRVCRG
ncbi:glycosyltransferase [Pseudomonas sp. RIT-PI-S]|uniref:glycosyltransferase n=1 Tax=Pseudomonas sp. RIT-PI-S TaxID=3035295 RepID=UPI0021DAAEA6|nr:glycosyltransferase [Pseudomonas sp. RIT-PI-S]